MSLRHSLEQRHSNSRYVSLRNQTLDTMLSNLRHWHQVLSIFDLGEVLFNESLLLAQIVFETDFC